MLVATLTHVRAGNVGMEQTEAQSTGRVQAEELLPLPAAERVQEP